MYETFCLKNIQGPITGYRWDQDEPAYVVCIVHGIGEHAGRYERVAGYLQEAGFAVLSMDLRGHGTSFGKRGHCAPREEVRTDVDDLIACGQRFYPGVPIILYGHSMGGNIVLDYRKQGSKNHVPQAFIVSAPWVQLVRQVSAPLYTTMKLLSKVAPSITISSGVSSSDLGNSKSVGDYEKDSLVHKKISVLCAAEGFDIGTAMAEGNYPDNGGAKGKPMLLMHGSQDKICSVQGSRKIAAAEVCDYIEWPGLYHEIHNGGETSTGEEVIEKMIQWIRDL